MKLFQSFFIVLMLFSHQSFYTLSSNIDANEPLLVVILMVKNEESVMEATLKPFFDADVKHYMILDTGSTDNTIPLTLKLFDTYNITHGYVREKAFIDFATSRNHAIEFAEELFPSAHFFLMIDAEWYVHKVDKLLDFCKDNINNPETIYLINISNHMFSNYLNRLFKPKKGIHFLGKIHEYPNRVASTKVPESYVYFQPSKDGQEKSRQRWYRDCNVLLKEYEKNPTDARTVFFLGQTYFDLQDYENACHWYEIRCKMHGSPDENYIAHYKLGDSYSSLNNWDNALKYYLKAYNMHPQRIEPLMRIAYHYVRTSDYSVAYLFAKHAISIPLSSNEVILVETICYDLGRYEILAIASWYLGEYETGYQALIQALEFFKKHPAESQPMKQKQQELEYNLSLFKNILGY